MFVRIFVGLALILYPLLVYLGIKVFEPKAIGIGLIVLLVIRQLALKKHLKSETINPVPITLGALLLALLGVAFNSLSWFLFYPALVSFIFLILFLVTLKKPPNMIERFAIAMGQPSSKELSSYTFKVTLVWCLFFILNMMISLYVTLYETLELWTLYNGLLSYCVMGVIFLLEYLVRPKTNVSRE